MSDEVEAVGLLWKAGIWCIGIAGTIIAFFTKRTLSRVDTDIKENASEIESVRSIVLTSERELDKFRLHVSEHYAKEQTMQHSLARIHDRMNELVEKNTVEKLGDEIGEIRTDIKSILKMVGGNGRT